MKVRKCVGTCMRVCEHVGAEQGERERERKKERGRERKKTNYSRINVCAFPSTAQVESEALLKWPGGQNNILAIFFLQQKSRRR